MTDIKVGDQVLAALDEPFTKQSALDYFRRVKERLAALPAIPLDDADRGLADLLRRVAGYGGWTRVPPDMKPEEPMSFLFSTRKAFNELADRIERGALPVLETKKETS